jgi:hypothetical protein
LEFGRTADASATDFRPLSGRKHYIDEADFPELIEDATRFVAQAGLGDLSFS